MLRDAIASYLDQLNEREFDVPFMSLLLKQGFYDIHFLHGQFEFGKDFIAKRDAGGETVQYVFQSKAGDIRNREFEEIRGQLDTMRYTPYAHPSMDQQLRRKFVLVTTGRLSGSAPMLAQAYDITCKAGGHMGFEAWDQNTLIEMMMEAGPNSAALREATPEYLRLLGTIRQKGSNYFEIERYAEQWIITCTSGDEKEYLGVILETALIIHELNKTNRKTLSCYTSLLPLRAIISALHSKGAINAKARACLQMVEEMFMVNMDSFFATLLTTNLLEDQFKQIHGFVAYPVLCMQTIELLGAYGLLHLKRGNEDRAREITDQLVVTIQNNAGCSHPISDRYAVSLISPILLLSKFGERELCKRLLNDVAVWVFERHETSDVGLAAPHASEEQEITTLLGYAFDFFEIPTRRESYLLTVVLDLCAAIGLHELYPNIVNDYLALNIHPCFIDVNDTPGQYIKHGDTTYCPNLEYQENWAPRDEWKLSSHHDDSPFFLQRNDLWWASIVMSTILRDRHSPGHLRKIFKELTS